MTPTAGRASLIGFGAADGPCYLTGGMTA